MKKLLTTGFCLLLGLSLLAGCGGGGSAIVGPPPQSPPPSNALRLDPHLMPAGWVGQLFSDDENGRVLGGVGLRSFRLKSGTLPAGLTLQSGGLLIGIPTAVYASTVVINITDSGNPPSSVNLSLSVTINPMLPLGITPASGALPGGQVGVRYNRQGWHCISAGNIRSLIIAPRCRYGLEVSATGGVVPYIFSWPAASGSLLPPGMSFSNGLIDGTPTTAGTYNFVVTATDSESPPEHVSANYSINVMPAPSPSPSPSP